MEQGLLRLWVHAQSGSAGLLQTPRALLCFTMQALKQGLLAISIEGQNEHRMAGWLGGWVAGW